MAGNTPFKHFKQTVHNGGIADPLIIHWPKGIKARGELRTQYHHIIDIAPTLLNAAGLELPPEARRTDTEMGGGGYQIQRVSTL